MFYHCLYPMALGLSCETLETPMGEYRGFDTDLPFDKIRLFGFDTASTATPSSDPNDGHSLSQKMKVQIFRNNTFLHYFTIDQRSRLLDLFWLGGENAFHYPLLHEALILLKPQRARTHSLYAQRVLCLPMTTSSILSFSMSRRLRCCLWVLRPSDGLWEAVRS